MCNKHDIVTSRILTLIIGYCFIVCRPTVSFLMEWLSHNVWVDPRLLTDWLLRWKLSQVTRFLLISMIFYLKYCGFMVNDCFVCQKLCHKLNMLPLKHHRYSVNTSGIRLEPKCIGNEVYINSKILLEFLRRLGWVTKSSLLIEINGLHWQKMIKYLLLGCFFFTIKEYIFKSHVQYLYKPSFKFVPNRSSTFFYSAS